MSLPLRLTLLRTPGISYSDQSTQDWGRHEFKYGIASHSGDWQKGETNWQGIRLNQPLIAFESPRHESALGERFSLLSVNNSHVGMIALKNAEQSDEFVVSLVEYTGRPQKDVHLTFPSTVASAREINGAEEEVRAATVAEGEVDMQFTPYQPRTFAIKLVVSDAKLPMQHSQPVTFRYDVSVASTDGHPSTDGLDDVGHALPAELLPATVSYDGVEFKLAPSVEARPSAVTARANSRTARRKVQSPLTAGRRICR